jgi:hypothetical protein
VERGQTENETRNLPSIGSRRRQYRVSMSSGNLAYYYTRGSDSWSIGLELISRTRKGTHEELGLGRGFILFEIGLLLAFRHRDVYDSDVLVESRSIAQRTTSTEFSLIRTSSRAETIPPAG